jgi:hypothetical protein
MAQDVLGKANNDWFVLFNTKYVRRNKMKKLLAKGLVLAFVGSLAMAGSAMALPTTADYWTLTDLTTGEDGSTDSSTNTISSAYVSIVASLDIDFFNVDTVGSFGLYYDINENGIIDTAERYQVIGNSSMGSVKSTTFFAYDSSRNTYQVASEDVWADDYTGSEVAVDFSNIFGFYFSDTLAPVNYYYTDTAFNNGGTEYISIDYDPFTAIITFDLNGVAPVDAIVSTDDIAPVPEPATMLLFGTGLAGLAGYGRRKVRKK